MNFKKYINSIGKLLFCLLFLLEARQALSGYEIFLYRVYDKKTSLASDHKIHLQGEFFGQIQYPSSFPSYNDLSGEDDRWAFGFHNIIFLSENTVLHAQLVTHDDGRQITKFDWHFSLRQNLSQHIALIIGHDSNHDSDHSSYVHSKPFYTNRNYVGFSLPINGPAFLIEPFTWFFHHSNERAHLDFSGAKLKQEYGLRLGALIGEQASLSFQLIIQSDSVFSSGQMLLADLIFRLRLTDWLELSAGSSWWKDRETSPAGHKRSFHKLIWGAAILF
jgi:hypothetical protein